jgi:threonine aldolase
MDFIDFRSDTVTWPTEEMLDAMRQAKVGDDVYEDDPTVKKLEEIAADAVGKEASLFVPSGTFGNQLAILTHTKRGDEVIVPKDNHIVIHEVGASAVISGVQLRTIASNFGQININELESTIRESDIHYPDTGLICTENAHSSGKVVPLKNLESVKQVAAKKGISVHMDGARIFNAAVASKIDAKDIASTADSVMFCLSKGLCSPVGSVLAGSKDFILKARKNRKLMGGGLRQAGYLAACGIISIEKMVDRLIEDHDNAKYLAEKLDLIKGIKVFKDRLDINMVFFDIDINFNNFNNFKENEFINYLLSKKIKINPKEFGEYRFVTHYWINKKDIDYTVKVIEDYFSRIS